jgi:hypothetical protein
LLGLDGIKKQTEKQQHSLPQFSIVSNCKTPSWSSA